jgi:peptidoglycan/xylan/chitin deacetylase (PgdA/CDA1 family)
MAAAVRAGTWRPTLLSRSKAALLDALERGRGLDALRWMSRRTPRILLYHRFGPHNTPTRMGVSAFDRQIAFLKQKFQIFPLSDLVARRRAGQAMPANAVALTFDDGYEDFYRFAYPVLKRHAAPATLYVVSRFVDGSQWLWPDRIEYAVKRTELPEIGLDLGPIRGRWVLGSEEERLTAWSDIADHCLTLGPERTQELTTLLAERLGVELPALPPDEFRSSSWEQLREMAAGNVEIGSHTRTHPRLSLLPDGALHEEIAGSKREIEAQLSRPVASFAYPQGAKWDFDERCKSESVSAGYASAVAGYYAPDVLGDLFAIKRVAVSPNWDAFVKVVYGVEHLKHVLQPRGEDGPSR